MKPHDVQADRCMLHVHMNGKCGGFSWRRCRYGDAVNRFTCTSFIGMNYSLLCQ